MAHNYLFNHSFAVKILYKRIFLLLMAFIPLTVLAAHNKTLKGISSETSAASTPYNLNTELNSISETVDTGFCKPIGLQIEVVGDPATINDTVFACAYQEITLNATFDDTDNMQYRWSEGSSNLELKLVTNGLGIDIKKVWLELTDPQSDCTYTDTLTIVFDFSSCVGVDEMNGNWPVRIFPNPTKDLLFIEYSDDSPVQIILSNINGQIVYQETLKSNSFGSEQVQLNLNFLPKGLYLLKLVSTDRFHIGKIILD